MGTLLFLISVNSDSEIDFFYLWHVFVSWRVVIVCLSFCEVGLVCVGLVWYSTQLVKVCVFAKDFDFGLVTVSCVDFSCVPYQ